PADGAWIADSRTLVRSSRGTGSARKCLIARAEWIVSNNPISLMVFLHRTRESALPKLSSNIPSISRRESAAGPCEHPDCCAAISGGIKHLKVHNRPDHRRGS